MPVKTVDAITSNNWSKLITTSWQALMHGNCAILSCPAISIFKHAAKLMGHQKIWDSTIISSNSGQVLYPSFFEATDFITEGFMQLCAFPGKLNKDEMDFDFFLDAWSDIVHTEGLSDADTEEIDSGDEIESRILEDNITDPPSPSGSRCEASEQPEQGVDRGVDSEEAEEGVSTPEQVDQEDEASGNRTNNTMDASEISLRDGDVMMWKVSVQDDLLRGELYLENSETPVMAWSVLESLSGCRLTPPCLHRRDAPAGEVGDQFLFSKGPATLRNPEEARILFDVGGRYADQLAGLEVQDYYPATIIHVYGCIGCALKICLEGDSRTACIELGVLGQKSNFYIASNTDFDILFGNNTDSHSRESKTKTHYKSARRKSAKYKDRQSSANGFLSHQETGDRTLSFQRGIEEGILLPVDDQARVDEEGPLPLSLADLEQYLHAEV
ncbi:hypothetical protein B7463_g6296, partial [Scytalidium lignicola]